MQCHKHDLRLLLFSVQQLPVLLFCGILYYHKWLLSLPALCAQQGICYQASICLSVCSILWHAVRECRQCHICQLTWSWTQTCLIQSLLVESYKSGVTPVYLSSLTDWHRWCCLFAFSCNWFILLCLYSQLIKIFILIPFFDLHLQWCLAYDSFFQGCVAVNFEACVRAWS